MNNANGYVVLGGYLVVQLFVELLLELLLSELPLLSVLLLVMDLVNYIATVFAGPCAALDVFKQKILSVLAVLNDSDGDIYL